MAIEETPGRQPLSPAVRRRLQTLMEHGSKVAMQGQYDYATDMFMQCVIGDPANPLYVKSFLANLSKKYGNNKKGSKMAGMKLLGTRAAVKKASVTKKWEELIKAGLEGLKENPWDGGILAAIGEACEHQGFDESQVEYLKQMVDADAEDEVANRYLGRAYDRTGQFDDALICFSRVLKQKPKDEEALKALSQLAVKKTIKKGGYEDATSSKDVRANKFRAESDDDDASLSPEEKYLRNIQKDPSDTNNYIELNDIYIKDEKFDKCVAIMKKALEVSGSGNIMIVERYEDAQLRLARQHVQTADQKMRDQKTPESVEAFKKMSVELNNKETEIYVKRCERYPTNLGFKYELAVRLQRAGKYVEAIKLFQEARTDMKRKGIVLASLGDCFYAIKQYRLALQNFDAAIPEISERDPEIFKGTMYKAARIAEHLKDWESAEKHYNALATHDFGYKDVAERLDKIREIRENNGDPDAS
jgi:tetratricopeptide (TPR) repeat protein